ncbi:hypothetical protein GLOIN_2v1778046 [Rhizophagus irregularis DAOM 181602=DAOM 197198]|nr:hypothetical protein GLOIN_2v1778046 [Rhizophagus irregularis DAOM 181602=DAOM 197198]
MALPVGFVMPELSSFEQDHEKFRDDFIAYIHLAGLNDEARIRNILDRSVKGEVREWYRREFENKNWELQNVLNNSAIGATIAHICGANAVAITGAVASFPNVLLGLTGADIIPTRGLDENWKIAGGRPTNAVPVTPNAGGGVPIILAGIRSGQRLDHIKNHFPSTDRYLRMFEIGALKQEAHESVSSYWAKILKYGNQLGYSNAQKKTAFMSRVRKDIKEEIYRIAEKYSQHRAINDILDSLAELELRRGVLGLPLSYLNYTPAPPAISNNIPQQQGISLADIQKIFQDAQIQQKTENQALIKKITELESQMAQQAQVPAPQTVEPVRQPKGPPSSLKTEEGLKNYYVAEYLKEVGLLNKEDLDSDYPSRRGINETRDAVNQLTNQFQKLNIRKCDICGETGHSKGSCSKRETARSNFNWGDGYDNEEQNRWYEQNRCYDPPLSPAMRKMCQSHTVREKESDEWFSSLQYLNAKIDDLMISNSFLDGRSEFGEVNDATINALGWKADKPSDFIIKGNSKHTTESLGWFTDVPVSIKDKDGKTVTTTGNFTRIDNGELEPMLCLGMTWIRKVQGIFDPNKDQF